MGKWTAIAALVGVGAVTYTLVDKFYLSPDKTWWWERMSGSAAKKAALIQAQTVQRQLAMQRQAKKANAPVGTYGGYRAPQKFYEGF